MPISPNLHPTDLPREADVTAARLNLATGRRYNITLRGYRPGSHRVSLFTISGLTFVGFPAGNRALAFRRDDGSDAYIEARLLRRVSPA